MRAFQLLCDYDTPRRFCTVPEEEEEECNEKLQDNKEKQIIMIIPWKILHLGPLIWGTLNKKCFNISQKLRFSCAC